MEIKFEINKQLECKQLLVNNHNSNNGNNSEDDTNDYK